MSHFDNNDKVHVVHIYKSNYRYVLLLFTEMNSPSKSKNSLYSLSKIHIRFSAGVIKKVLIDKHALVHAFTGA